MEEPNPRIIRHNPKRDTGPRRDMDRVPPHRVRLAFYDGRVEGRVGGGVVVGAVDELHCVAVEVAVSSSTSIHAHTHAQTHEGQSASLKRNR